MIGYAKIYSSREECTEDFEHNIVPRLSTHYLESLRLQNQLGALLPRSYIIFVTFTLAGHTDREMTEQYKTGHRIDWTLAEANLKI